MKITARRMFKSIASDNRASLPTLASMLTLVLLLAMFTLPAAHAQTYSVIHTFVPGLDNGAYPNAGVTKRGGVLYGTTFGGAGGGLNGSVYQMTQVGSEWTLKPISLFNNPWYEPKARVVLGPDGHLYGTTPTGDRPYQGGVVYNLTPPLSICKVANCSWKQTVVHDFTGTDGLYPEMGDLVWDQQGNMYGTTSAGGANTMGTVFLMTKAGNGYIESTIYNFSGSDGRDPQNGVILDSQGNLFGTTWSGGPNGAGTVFKLSNIPGVGWTQTILYGFASGDVNGEQPLAGLTMDSFGNLYGATSRGGGARGGTIFELSPSGDTYTFNLLYSFPGNSAPCGPAQSLSLDAAGNLYGTTQCGGANRQGSIFKLTKSDNGWEYTSLHDFTGGADGADPVSQVTIDTDGTLYGTTFGGGNLVYCSSGCGVVWMVKP